MARREAEGSACRAGRIGRWAGARAGRSGREISALANKNANEPDRAPSRAISFPCILRPGESPLSVNLPYIPSLLFS